MSKRAFFSRFVATVLSLVLVVLSPGLDPYRALASAAALAAPMRPGGSFMPNAFLSGARGSGRFDGVTSNGIEVGGLLSGLSGENLRAPEVRRFLEGMPPVAGEAQFISQITARAAAVRAEADALVKESEAGFPNIEKAETMLARVEIGVSLLDPARAKSFSAAREELKIRRADATVKATVQTWDSKDAGRAEGPAVKADAALVGDRARLKPASGDPAVRQPDSAAKPLGLFNAVLRRDMNLKKIGPWAAAGAAVAAAAVLSATTVGLLPLALVSAGVMGSVLAHEMMHLWVLERLGDDTAPKHGDGSLNPLKHVDPWGTLFVPAVGLVAGLAFLGLPLIVGWAKPIAVNFNRLAKPKADAAKVGLAGPAGNFALALAFFGAATLLPVLGLASAAGTAAFVLMSLAKINLAMGAFNLLPVPGLDGFRLIIWATPDRLYRFLSSNPNLPKAYQGTFYRIFEGWPTNILTRLRVSRQGQVNWIGRAINLAVMGAASAAAFWATGRWIFGTPLFFMLSCSYDYYCIREKIQNEEAVQALIPILMDAAGELTSAVEAGDGLTPEFVDSEEVHHVFRRVFEDTLDQAIDTIEGFDSLSDEDKSAQFEALLKDNLARALHQEALPNNDPAAIRKYLDSERGRKLFPQLAEWIKQNEVWEKWRSPKRKAEGRVGHASGKGKKAGSVGGKLALAALLVGGGLLGGALFSPALAAVAPLGLGLMIGSVQDAGKPGNQEPEDTDGGKIGSYKSFRDLILKDPNVKLELAKRQKLVTLLTEMKFEKKPPVIGRIEEINRALMDISGPRGDIKSLTLIGKAGVGKTAIVEGIAQALALSDGQPSGSVFQISSMEGRHLLRLNLPLLLNESDPVKALTDIFRVLSSLDGPVEKGNRITLFIDEIHMMFNPNDARIVQMPNLLKEPLRDGKISIIAATTEEEYKKYIEVDDALKRRLPPIRVAESTVSESLRDLEGARSYYEKLNGVTVSHEALKAAAELSKFDQEIFLPGRAFKYLLAALKAAGFSGRRDRLSLAIQNEMKSLRYTMRRLSDTLSEQDSVTKNIKEDEPTTIGIYNQAVEVTRKIVELYRRRAAIPADGVPVVTEEMVKEEISSRTGVASGQLTLGRESPEKYLKMEETLGKRVVGQDDAVHTIAEAVRMNKAGMSDPNRPIGVFYLTGPTGTGKTYLAKELARFLFDDPEAVIRLDMGEYSEKHASAKMMGSPPGYVGYEEGGQLTEAVRKKPYSVILFDEIEKAHPNLWSTMLQIIGEGRLTDGKGRTVDFKNTIMLMTSNLGMATVDVEPYVRDFQKLQAEARLAMAAGDAAALAKVDEKKRALALELSEESKASAVKVTEQAFKESYPPEFRGRLHADPIIFNRLTPDLAKKIVDLDMRELGKVLSAAGHEIEWTAEVVDFLVNEGYDVELGARPIQNTIDRLVTKPLSREILKSVMAGGGKPGPVRVKASLEAGAIRLEIAPLAPKPVSKQEPGDEATGKVFAEVLQAVLKAAAGQVASDPALLQIDAWVRAALGDHPQETAPKVPAPAAEPQAPAADAPAAEPAAPAPAKRELLSENEPLDLGASPADLPVLEFKEFALARQALASDLGKNGYDEAARETLLRTVPNPADTYVGWLKLFMLQAQKMARADVGRGQSPQVRLAYSIGAASARLVIHRNGEIGSAEADLLRRHFTGPAPSDAARSQFLAEHLNIRGVDGRRDYFELHRQLASIPGARLGFATGDKARGGGGADYWIKIPRSAVSPGAPAAGGADQQARKLAKFLAALLEQGDKRSPAVRIAAAEALAALDESPPESAVLHAREWLLAEKNIPAFFAEIIAAARVLGRHGSRSEDEAALLRAAGVVRDHSRSGNDLLRPVKVALAESLARLLSPRDEADASRLLERYQGEKAKPREIDPVGESRFGEVYNPVVDNALYIALAERGGADLKRVLMDDWRMPTYIRVISRSWRSRRVDPPAPGQTERLQALYGYLKRTDPESLRGIVEDWRNEKKIRDDSPSFLLLNALADQGDSRDLEGLLEIIRTEWGGVPDRLNMIALTESAARLAARLGAQGGILPQARAQLDDFHGNGGLKGRKINLTSLIFAVRMLGEAGDQADLELLERLLRIAPEDLRSFGNSAEGYTDAEAFPHEVASAWAEIADRKGLVDISLIEGAEPAMPKLVGMLTDVNPMVNKAALEAVELRFSRR